MDELQEDAKKLLPFVQAMAEGKTVESMVSGNWLKKCNSNWCAGRQYRIKPQTIYRPYTRDECVEHCLGKVVVNNDWESVMVVTAVTDKAVYNGMDMSGRSFEWLLAKCTHLNGFPCGMKEDDSARSY